MPGPTRPTITATEKQTLVRQLQRRAVLLRPSAELINLALQKCIAFDRRSGRLTSRPDGSSSSGPAVPTEVAAAQTQPEEGEPPPPPRSRDGKEGPILQIGQEVAGYRIEGVLGSGGMGQVFRALQISMNRTVAFKVLAPRFTGSASFRSRFIREARNAGRLQHPNLISVHDVGEAQELLFFSMELVQGESIGDLIKREGGIDETRALAIALQVFDALKYAHDNQVVHRDIKPDNLMLMPNGTVKVADLGLSRGLDSALDGTTTQSGAMMGTPYYMPPEQGRDSHAADHRADIYAVGATLFHMICGGVPFNGRSAVEVVLKATTKPLRFPDPGPSQPVRRLLARLMAKDPDQRPQSAAEAHEAVDRVLRTMTRNATTGPGTRETSGALGGGRRRWWTAGLVIGLLVVAIGLGVWLLVARAQVDRAWRAVAVQVEGHLAEEHYPAARDAIDDFIGRMPRAQDRARPLRDEVISDWNRRAVELAKPDLDRVDTRIAAFDYAGAAAILDGLEEDPLLASPQVKILVRGKREDIRDLEQETWNDRLLPQLRDLHADGRFAEALTKLIDYRPDAEKLREASQSWRRQLASGLDQATATPAWEAADWLQGMEIRTRGGQSQWNDGSWQLSGRGVGHLLDRGTGMPASTTVELAISIPAGGQVFVGLGARASRRQGYLMEPGAVRVVDGAGLPLRQLLRQRDDVANWRERLSERIHQDGIPVAGTVELRLRITADRLIAELPSAPDRSRIELPRRRGDLLTLHWQSPETWTIGLAE